MDTSQPPFPEPPVPVEETKKPITSTQLISAVKRLLWRGNIGPAFWNIASIISLSVNVILIIILILVAKQLFTLKDLVSNQLISGLHQNFIKMDQARITTSVKVNDTIPVVFDLPVQADTTVVLRENTRIKNAIVNLSTGGLSIVKAPANIVLPAGTKLPISLNITVPVSTTVPVALTVPVDIPLNKTELHDPFVGLQSVVSPYDNILAKLPNSWDQTPLCQTDSDWLCGWLMEK